MNIGLAKVALVPKARMDDAIRAIDAGAMPDAVQHLRAAYEAAKHLDMPAWRAAIMVPAAEAGLGRLPNFEIGQLARRAAQIVAH